MLQPRGLILAGILLCTGTQVGHAAPPPPAKQKTSQVQKRKAFVVEMQERWIKACNANHVQVSMILATAGPGAKELIIFEGLSWNAERAAILVPMQKQCAELGFKSIVFAQPRKKDDSPESLYVFRDEKTNNKQNLTAFSVVKL